MSETPEPRQPEGQDGPPEGANDGPAGEGGVDAPVTDEADAADVPTPATPTENPPSEPKATERPNRGRARPGSAINVDDMGDAASIPDDLDNGGTPTAHGTADWDSETSAHRVIVALKRVEADVRELLQGRDPRRKRKLSGSRRWRELEEDLLAWKFSGRIDEDALRRLHRLILRRDHLFRRLRFLAGSRPS